MHSVPVLVTVINFLAGLPLPASVGVHQKLTTSILPKPYETDEKNIVKTKI